MFSTKILEEWGVQKVEFFYQFLHRYNSNYRSIYHLFHSKIIYLPIILAFIIGFIFTLPIIFFELFLNIYIEPTLDSIFLYLLVNLLSIFLEFYFLFLLGFITLAYYIHHLYLIDALRYNINEKEFLDTLVRTVMELPQKRIMTYNLNPYEYQEKKIFLLSLLYKAKVITTNFLLKFILKKVLTRSSFRLYSAYIAAPITGIWDSFVFLKTISDSRYKIMVRFTLLYLLQQKMEILQKDSSIQMILFRYYYFGEHNNSLDKLLESIYQVRAFNYSKDNYLKADLSNKKLFSLLFALKHGLFSSKERMIMDEFNIYTYVQEIRKDIKNSNMQKIKEYIDLI